MQTLQIILTIVSILAYLATSYMAIMAFFYLRHLKKNKEVLREVLKRLLMLSIANEVRENMRDVNEMKIDFQRLIENEQFEDAEQLKKIISRVEGRVKRMIDELNDGLGDGKVEQVIISAIKDKKM